MRNLIITMGLILSLQGCVFAIGAAAGAAGIAAVYDHRKLENVLKDQHITKMISDQITRHELRDKNHIEITSFNQIVLLTGETTTQAERQQVEQIARSTPDVQRVYNAIMVKGATSSLTHASDSWITTKIKTEMLATEDLKSGSIKVVTENGTVYLMGIVSHGQADMAVDIARQVSGVQRVIKIFQYNQ